jgi:hypothetical protein
MSNIEGVATSFAQGHHPNTSKMPIPEGGNIG